MHGEAGISRRELLKRALALAATTYALPGLNAQTTSAPYRPNIILISVDTLRADHMSLHGYGRPTTPSIDRMASEGVSFNRAYSVTAWTGTSHASIFTGVYPPAHQLDNEELKLAEGWPTMAGYLREAGYKTHALVSGPMVEKRLGFGQGFETFDESTYKSSVDFAALRKEVDIPNITDRAAMEEILLYKTRTAATVRHAAEAFIDSAPPDPWFLFLHFWDVHGDYDPPQEFDKFDPSYRGAITGNMKDARIHAQMDPRDLQHFMSLYDGEILWTDYQIGLLLDHLRRKASKDTCVILFSDHGEEFFEYGNKGHGHNLHDILIRVPLIFWWPGTIPGGLRIEQPISTVDITPTVLQMAGVARPDYFQGHSLMNALQGRPAQMEPASQFGSLFFRGRSEIYGISWPLKLIQKTQSGELFLYNLQIDPTEKQNLSPQFSALAQRQNDRLRQWWEGCERIKPHLPGAIPLANGGQAALT